MDQHICGHKNAAFIFLLHPCLFIKNFDSLFNTVLGKDVLICDDVGWWIGLNKGGDVIYSVDIGLRDIVEGKGTNNQVTPAHGAPI